MLEIVAADQDPERVLESIQRILQASTLCSLSTVEPKGTAYINTAFFSYTSELELYFLSNPSTQHSQNLNRSGSAAMAVFTTQQGWGSGELAGLQLFGRCALAEDVERAQRSYADRFEAYSLFWKGMDPSEQKAFPGRFYVFLPEKVKVFDEAEFGEDVYVVASVFRR